MTIGHSITPSGTPALTPAVSILPTCVGPGMGPGAADWDRLPAAVRLDTERRLAICLRIERAANRQAEIHLAAAEFDGQRGFARNNIQRFFYLWLRGNKEIPPKDWRLCVDRARAGALWWRQTSGDHGLPAEFLDVVRELWASNKRSFTQAHAQLQRWWETGYRRDALGRLQRQPIPGYGYWEDWYRAQYPGHILPARAPWPMEGWSLENLRRRLHLSKATKLAVRQGIATARSATPFILRTREGARPLELVYFDDVKVDFRVIDPVTGQVCDLWLLVAMDYATGCILGFWMRPAKSREDGTQEHLRLSDMKAFAGWLLERFGLPRGYVVTWKVENGTATFSDAVAAALGQLLGERLVISYGSMVTGKSGAGLKERSVGNSRAKAHLEASFNLLHNVAADLPGQTGRRWDVRPADLAAREKLATEQWATISAQAPEVMSQARLGLLMLNEARDHLRRVFHEMNSRTNHSMEGFEDLWQWAGPADGLWKGREEFVKENPTEFRTRIRKESPYERLARLAKAIVFDQVPGAAMAHFYETSQHSVRVNERGEIEFEPPKEVEHLAKSKKLIFCRPSGDTTDYRKLGSLLAYYCPQEPDWLHLTRPAPHHGYVACWARRGRVGLHDDPQRLADAFRYTGTAWAAERQARDQVLAPERATLAEAAAHNAALVSQAGMDASVRLPAPSSGPAIAPVVTGMAAARAATRTGTQARHDTQEAIRRTARRAALNADLTQRTVAESPEDMTRRLARERYL